MAQSYQEIIDRLSPKSKSPQTYDDIISSLLDDDQRRRLEYTYTYENPTEVGPPESLAGTPEPSLFSAVAPTVKQQAQIVKAGGLAALKSQPASYIEKEGLDPSLAALPPAQIADYLTRKGLQSFAREPAERLRERGQEQFVESLPGIVESGRQAKEAIDALEGSPVKQKIAEIVAASAASAPSLAPLLGGAVTGLATRSPVTAGAVTKSLATLPAAQAYTSSYFEAKAQGKDDDFAHKYALAQSGLEYMFEAAAPGVGKTVLGTAAKKLAYEPLSEGATSAMQQNLQHAVLPEAAPQSVAEAAEDIGMGAAVGSVFSGVASPAVILDSARQVAQQRQALEVDPAIQAATDTAKVMQEEADAQVEQMLTEGETTKPPTIDEAVEPPSVETITNEQVKDNQPVTNIEEALTKAPKEGTPLVGEVLPVEPVLTEEPVATEEVPSTAPLQPEALASQEDVEAALKDVQTEEEAVASEERRQNVLRALSKDSSTKDVPSVEGFEVVTRSTAPQTMDIENDFGQYDPVNNKVYINSEITKPEDAVAVTLHELAHSYSETGQKVGRPSVDRIIQPEQRPKIIERIQSLASSGSPVAQRTIERAEGKPEEFLSYFVEEIKKERDSNRPLGQRVASVFKDVVASVKGFLQDKGIGKNWNISEADVFRAAKIMAETTGKQRALPAQRAAVPPAQEVLKSRRPAQPKLQQKAAAQVARLSPQVPASGKGIRLDETVLGVSDKKKSTRVLERGKFQRASDVATGLISQIANQDRSVYESLKRAKGEVATAIVDAAQITNSLENAIKRDAGHGLKPNKKSFIQSRNKTEINTLLKTLNEGYDSEKSTVEFDKASVKLARDYPNVFNVWQRERARLDKMSVELMRKIADKPGGMTNQDIDSIKAIRANLGQYITRQYRVYQGGSVSEDHTKNVLQDWKDYLATPEQERSKIPKDKQTFAIAKDWIKNFVIDIGDFSAVEKAAKEDLDTIGLDKLEHLYSMWVPKNRQTKLAQDSTIEQKEAWVDKVVDELKATKNALSDKEYLAKLEDKAVTTTTDFLESFSSGKMNPLVEYFSSLRGESGILKKRKSVPKEIRNLMGEITDPIIQIHQTHLAMGKELSRINMLNNIFYGNEGTLWVDPANVTKEQADVFSVTLKGDRYGPLNGKRVSRLTADQLDTLEKLNHSIESFIKASTNTDVDSLQSMLSNTALKVIGKTSAFWKISNIVANSANMVMDNISTVFSVSGDGHIPYANKEARDFALGAAWNLINSTGRTELRDSAREVLRNYLSDSGQIGEIQEADFKRQEELFLNRLSPKNQKSFMRRFANGLLETNSRFDYVVRTVADTKAMADLVGKFYNYAMEKKFVEDLEQAKVKDNPKYTPLTPDQIEMRAAAAIDDTNIGYHRAPPVGKILDRFAMGFLLNFFLETARTGANKYLVAQRTFKEAFKHPKGSNARELLLKRATQRTAGAMIYTVSNEAMVKSVSLLYVLSMMIGDEGDKEELEEELALIEDFRSALRPGERSKAWVFPTVVDGKLFMFDGSRLGVSEPTSQPAIDMLVGATQAITTGNEERLDRSVDAIQSLFSEAPILSKFLKGRAPGIAKQDPDLYKFLLEKFPSEGSANRVGALYEFLPRQLRQIRQINAENSPQSELPVTGKVALAAGFNLRMYDPVTSLPNSVFEYKDFTKSARDKLKNIIKYDKMTVEEFEEKYLSLAEQKVNETDIVLSNIALSRKLVSDDTILQALTEGAKGGRGGNISKGEAKNLLEGVPTTVLLKSSDIDSMEDKEIAAFSDNPAEQELIKAKYKKYRDAIEKMNSGLTAPQDTKKKGSSKTVWTF